MTPDNYAAERTQQNRYRIVANLFVYFYIKTTKSIFWNLFQALL